MCSNTATQFAIRNSQCICIKMTISFIHNTTVKGLCLFDCCEDSEHHISVSGRNVEAAIAMTPMEHLYFTSDKLEYYPHDWTPCRTNHRNDLLSNSSQSFIDSFLKESPQDLIRVFSPLKNSVCRLGTQGNPSLKGHCDIPSVYPVTFDEYCDFIRQRGHDFTCNITFKTTHNDTTPEVTKPTRKVAKKKAPIRKARKNSSTKLKVKFGKVSVRSIPRIPMNSIINRKKSNSK